MNVCIAVGFNVHVCVCVRAPAELLLVLVPESQYCHRSIHSSAVPSLPPQWKRSAHTRRCEEVSLGWGFEFEWRTFRSSSSRRRCLHSSNILLDHHLTAKLGDFGLARFAPEGSRSSTTTLGNTARVRGTLAYLPDEYVRKGQLGTSVDVYSFGVVRLWGLMGTVETSHTYSRH